MSKIGTAIPNDKKQYEISSNDLPLHCPMPKMSLWNSHPRVFLPVAKGSKAKCPYCGTEYVLES
jgi:uncharacterized Zn-finger protein